MKVRTSELMGAALDWAVAMCEDMLDQTWPDGPVAFFNSVRVGGGFHYSTDLSQAGPIIDRERITLDARESDWQARIWNRATCDFIEVGRRGAYCTTALIAAMRCRVASKLGDEVEVPDELMENNE